MNSTDHNSMFKKVIIFESIVEKEKLNFNLNTSFKFSHKLADIDWINDMTRS